MTFNEFLEEQGNNIPQDIIDRLEELKNVNERDDYHPEPNVFEHIRIVFERCSKTLDIDLVLAALFHDIGKRECLQTNPKTGKPMTPGHEKVAARLCDQHHEFINSFEEVDFDTVKGICEFHMKIKQWDNMKESKKEEMRNLPFFDKLVIFNVADDMLISDEQFNAKTVNQELEKKGLESQF